MSESNDLILGKNAIKFLSTAFGITQRRIRSITVSASFDGPCTIDINCFPSGGAVDIEEISTEERYEVTLRRL